MKRYFECCYKWVQAYLVARSCSEKIMYLETDISRLNEQQLEIYKEIIDNDLESGIFGEYILFRISILLENMMVSLAKEGQEGVNKKYNGMNIIDLISQTVEMLVMVSDSLFAPDGRFIHKIQNELELSNIEAFNKSDGRNLKSFGELLNTMIDSRDNYDAMKTSTIIFNIIEQLEEMVFDVEYVLLHKQDIIDIGDVTYGDLNKFLDILIDRIERGVYTIFNLYQDSDVPKEHMDMKNIKIKMDNIHSLAEKEILKVKMHGLESEPISLYIKYAGHLDRFIRPELTYKGLSMTALEWIECNNQ